MNTNTTSEVPPTIITVTIAATSNFTPWLAMIINRDSFSLSQSAITADDSVVEFPPTRDATVEGVAYTHSKNKITLSLVRDEAVGWGWRGVMTLTVPPPEPWNATASGRRPPGRTCLVHLLQEVEIARGGDVTEQTCDPRNGVEVAINNTPAEWGQYPDGEWYITN